MGIFKIHPYPVELRKELKKITYMLDSFMDTVSEQGDKFAVPGALFKKCKGMALMVMSHTALAFVGTKYGTGVVIKKQGVDPSTGETVSWGFFYFFWISFS